jgi:hypothetical protein
MLKQRHLESFYEDFREYLLEEVEQEDWEDIDKMIHEYNLDRLERI